jgi:hypothetical protein
VPLSHVVRSSCSIREVIILSAVMSALTHGEATAAAALANALPRLRMHEDAFLPGP